MRLHAFVVSAVILASSGTARADLGMTPESDSDSDAVTRPAGDSAPPDRPRHSPPLYAAGLTTAVVGGVALHAGGLSMLMSNGACTIIPCVEADRPDEPMAVVGGRREPARAQGSGHVPILTF